MRPEPGTPALANMSAPPRSTVMLPRLTASPPMADDAAQGAGDAPAATREVPVGPGGGRLTSNALCLARVELPTAVCAHLRMGYGSPLLTRPLGLARALLAIARHAGGTKPGRQTERAARLEVDRIVSLPEGDLVQELTARLESHEWPEWVPRVAMVTPLGIDPGVRVHRGWAPKLPEGITCPLLAAKVASAMRGPVFLRDAAPALTHLLDLFGTTSPSGTWELWLPVRPGTVTPLMPATSTKGENP